MTRTPLRLLLVSAACVAALAACNRDRKGEQAPAAADNAANAAATAPAAPAAPMNYESDTPYAEVKLTLPPEIARYPELHARLYASDVNDLTQFNEGAQADHTEEGQDMPAYTREITWSQAGATPRLVSMRKLSFEFTGGAHPNTAFGALLWDVAGKREVTAAHLFRPGADLSALDRALCDAINQAKRARVPDAPRITLQGARDVVGQCPRAARTPFVLAGSDVAGKAGGLAFLIGPYQVGPYAEGSYEIVVPQSAFAALLAPEWAGEFAGTPPRVGDVTQL